MRLWLVFFLLAPGVFWAQPLQRCSFSHGQMGTVFRLVFYARDSLQAAVDAVDIFARVDTLNAVMSDYLPESELNRLCATAGSGKKIAVSKDLWRILALSKKYSRRSRGAFDVSIGPLTRLWRRARHLEELPDSSRIHAAAALVDYRKIKLYRWGRCVALQTTGMQLDLGGIAQGYAADICLHGLQRRGYRSVMVDAGGDIALGDAPPLSAGWQIALEGLPDTFFLKKCAITASGATLRYLEAPDGTRYSHIIDPRSGWGVTSPVVVVVKTRRAVAADAWATALSVTVGGGRRPRFGRVWLSVGNAQ
ncbi:MAG: FAD:protein FMN transferase [Lewinellaceae bacterium]|nr:FAD:protein FMN transferase [Lewinellaceae bacterium]